MISYFYPSKNHLCIQFINEPWKLSLGWGHDVTGGHSIESFLKFWINSKISITFQFTGKGKSLTFRTARLWRPSPPRFDLQRPPMLIANWPPTFWCTQSLSMSVVITREQNRSYLTILKVSTLLSIKVYLKWQQFKLI